MHFRVLISSLSLLALATAALADNAPESSVACTS